MDEQDREIQHVEISNGDGQTGDFPTRTLRDDALAR